MTREYREFNRFTQFDVRTAIEIYGTVAEEKRREKVAKNRTRAYEIVTVSCQSFAPFVLILPQPTMYMRIQLNRDRPSDISF